ncbi:MAG: hypothetical protein ACK5LC_01965 [Coprobacillaceae bacterium]
MKVNKKFLDKELQNAIKPIVKEYKLKSRGITLFKEIDDYFIYITISISGMKKEKIAITGYIKPFIIDDLFWKVFNMSNNSNEPISLRANGAFKIDGLTVFSKNIEYEEIENIPNLSKELLRECYNKIVDLTNKFSNVNEFLVYSEKVEKKVLYDYNLVKMLLLINEEKYVEAKGIAEEQIKNHKYGRFQNEGKFIYDHIVDYCNLHKE